MADLDNLKDFAKDITPVVQELFKVAEEEAGSLDNATVDKAVKAIAKLDKLLDGMGQQTTAECADRLEAAVEARRAVNTIRDLAVTHEVALTETQRTQLKDHSRKLRLAVDELIEECVQVTIASLISDTDLTKYKAAAERARVEIRDRKNAKTAIDVSVQLIIIAAKIALKVAAA